VAYDVKTPVFEGPLDLLLHLIARHEVDLYEISLESIVDAYLAELERMHVLDLDVATEFLLIAATLVELKSRRLLPEPVTSELEDDLSLLEERDVLVVRLLECLTFREAGAAIARLAQAAGRSQPRLAGPEAHFLSLAPDLLVGVDPDDLRAALLRLAVPAPGPRVELDHVTVVHRSVGDALAQLVAVLPGLDRATFRELTAGASGRMDVIVAFLAVLELYKQGLVELEQSGTFGALEVCWTGEASGADVVADLAHW